MAKVQQIGSNEATGIYDYYTSASERLKAREYEASEGMYQTVLQLDSLFSIGCCTKRLGKARNGALHGVR
ncbi:hypothetical protein NYV35_25535 [Escherichia coli]|nr:hypothetical protein [Escherichia coli]